MSWRDKLLLKIMGSTVVIKIMSMPIVVKILTVETRAFLWVASLFSREKKAAQPDQSHPFDPAVYRLRIS
jgi:hypothetical protein